MPSSTGEQHGMLFYLKSLFFFAMRHLTISKGIILSKINSSFTENPTRKSSNLRGMPTECSEKTMDHVSFALRASPLSFLLLTSFVAADIYAGSSSEVHYLRRNIISYLKPEFDKRMVCRENNRRRTEKKQTSAMFKLD